MQPERFVPPVGPLTPPVKPKDDECCHLDCPNCVLLVYQVCWYCRMQCMKRKG
jgi:hypothetical protein